MRFQECRLVHAAESIGPMTNMSSGMRLGSRKTAIVRPYLSRLPLGGLRRACAGGGAVTDASGAAARKVRVLMAWPRWTRRDARGRADPDRRRRPARRTA